VTTGGGGVNFSSKSRDVIYGRPLSSVIVGVARGIFCSA